MIEMMAYLMEYEVAGGVWDDICHAVKNLETVFGVSQEFAEEVVLLFSPATKA